MPDFKFPGDATSLPEYRLFKDAYRRVRPNGHPGEPLVIFTTLKLILSYQASVTERPGFLNQQSMRLLEMELEENGIPINAALEAMSGTLLERLEDGWIDRQFAKANPELSPKHRRIVDVGAAHSIIKRNRRNIEAAASQQQMLLPPEIFRDASGAKLDAMEASRVLNLIGTVDRCLGRPARANREITAGLVADGAMADRVIRDWDEERRYRFFYWIADMKGDPRMHQTTELILSHFAQVLEWYKAKDA